MATLTIHSLVFLAEAGNDAAAMMLDIGTRAVIEGKHMLTFRNLQAVTVRVAALGLYLALGCALTASPSAAQPSAEAEKAAIRAVIQRMQDAWNRGDFRGYMEGFKNPDVTFVSGGRFQNGWQGTLEHYIRDYGSSAEARGQLRFYDIRIEILAPDAAQLISRYELLRPEHPQYGINTRLMRKVAGRWVIALNHVSSTETPPTDAPAPAK